MLAWLGGADAQLFQPTLWPALQYAQWCGVAGGVALGAVAAAFAAKRTPWAGVQRIVAPLLLAALALAGFASTGWRAVDRLAETLSPTLEGRTVIATGVVASLPQRLPGATRFVFELESAQSLHGEAVTLPHRVMIGWYHDDRSADREDAGDAVSDADQERAALRAGQRWRLPLRLKRPHGALNPGGFDYELWLFEQRVRAAGYVHPETAAVPQRLPDAGGHLVDRLRQQLRDAIDARVPDPTAAGVLAALAVGDEGAIGHADWQVFRSTGVPHLVVISGLHVTMIAWFAMVAIGWLWRRSAACMLWCPAPLAARWGGLLLAVGYAVLAGWGVPAQRAVWMLGVTTLLGTLGLRWPWPLVLLAAAAVVVLVDPWALLQPGFWLSFAAVALLMSSSPARGEPAPTDSTGSAARRLLRRLGRHVGEGARTQAVATFGLAPLTLVIFRQLSLVAFAANLVSIPLVTLVITPLALLGALLPPLWSIAAWVVQGWMHALTWAATWPRAVWTVPAAPAWAMALGLLAGTLVMLPLPRRLRWLALPLALPLLWPAPPRPAAGHFELLAADIGQGTAVLLRTQSHLLLFDTGPQYGPDSDAGDRVLLPLLRYRGEGPLDLLMLSHSDLDHVGGAAAILGAWPVRLISSSLPAGHPLLRRGVPHRPCSAGQRWDWDSVQFEVLSPRAEALHWPAGAKPPKPNFLSCVLRVVDAQGRAALLTGDAEAPQETQMIAGFGAGGLRSEVLIVPHHGSRTSSSAPFLDAVRPRVAVVQAGYRNRFGHPAPDVVARYAARGITVVRSDRCGAWRWNADGAQCEREVDRRYWQFVP